MKRLSLCSIVLAGVLSTSVWAGSFTVGVEAQNYLPISNGEGGDYKGYARELLDAFAAKAGHKFTYKTLPVARLNDEYLVQKSFDLKFPDNPYWAADMKKDIKISYSTGVVNVAEGLVVPTANKGKPVTGITKIAQIRGFTPYPYLGLIKDKKIAVTEVNEATAALSMAEAGRVDGVYMGKIAANYILSDVMKKTGVLVFDESLPNSKSDFTLSSITHPEVIKQFSEYLSNEKDLVAKLKAKYKIVE